MFVVFDNPVSDEMTMYCRNCNEVCWHKKIMMRKLPWTDEHATPLQRAFHVGKSVPVYACKICGCETVVMKQR